MFSLRHFLTFAGVITLSIADQPEWAQCGGIGYTGSTVCVAPYVCTVSNPYYSQCLPGTSNPTTTTTTKTTTTIHTSVSSSTSSSASATTTGGGGGNTAGCPFSTLQSGYLWLRSVESPTFHEYVQSSTLCNPSDGVVGPYTTAANVQIVNGQLTQLVSTTGSLLYAHIVNSTATDKLQLIWSTTQNTFGTFSWSGDALDWSVSTINRPNVGAWLVCTTSTGETQVWANLGNYGYMTPAGCTDTTLNYYNAATATNRVRL